MKNTIKFLPTILLISLLFFSLVGCSKYKYNYNDGVKKLQYDETLLIATMQEGSNDIIIKPKDGSSRCFVDATVTTANYGNYADILDYMKVIYTYNNTSNVTDILKEETTTKNDYGTCKQTNYEYSYIIDNEEVIVKSKAIQLNETQTFIVVQKITKGFYDQNTIAALETTYNSCEPIK